MATLPKGQGVFLPPFKAWLASNIPAVYDNTMTYYEELVSLIKYLQDIVVPAVNNNASAVTTISKAVEQLQSYVENYFDNLDVQEEINNKLDEMAESGELAEIIEAYYEGNIRLIFPEYGAEGTDTLGDCSIIKNGDKSLMIDTFTGAAVQPECYQKIRQALYNAGITTLSYLIITHYHGDHVGNVINLINDGYLVGATVYLPRVAQSYPEFNGSYIKTALTNAGITWIEIDNQTFTLGNDVTVRMLNGSAADYQYYEDLAQSDSSYNNAYNDRSIVSEITYRNKHLLFTGDLEMYGCEYITDKLSYCDYDLLHDCHHGYIGNAPTFCSRVNPNFVVIPASIGMVNKNYSTWLVNSAYWVRKSKNVALQGYQNEEMVFTVDINGLHTNNTYFVNDLSCNGNLPFHVNSSSADNIRSGSKNHPFKTLNEAMIFCPKNEPEEIQVFIHSLPASNYKVYVKGFNNLSLNFDSGVQFNNVIQIDECKRCVINGLTQTSGNLAINHSSVILRDYTNTTGGNALNIYDSSVIIDRTINLTIDTADAIICRYNSKLTLSPTANGLTLTYASGTTHRFINSYFASVYFNEVAIGVLRELPFNTKIMPVDSLNNTLLGDNAKILLTLYEDNTGTYSGGNLKESINAYQFIVVDYIDSDGFRKIEKFAVSNNRSLSTTRNGGNGTELYIKSCALQLSGSTFTVAGNRQAIIRTDGTNQIESGNYIRVKGIYGRSSNL